MKNLKLFFGLLAGAAVYNYLTWEQELGLNSLVFSILLITSVFLYKKEARKSKRVVWTAAAWLVSTIGVILTGIDYSKAIYYLCLLVFLSFVQLPELRSLVYAASSAVTNFFTGIKLDFQLIGSVFGSIFKKKEKSKGKTRDIYVYLGRGVIVFLSVAVFFIIFTISNPQFRKLCINIVAPVEDFFNYIFEHIEFGDIIHYLFVCYFLSLFFLYFKGNAASRKDASGNENIERKRMKIYDNFLTMGLKDECKTATLSIALINILLLGVNLSDIFSVWLGIVPDTANELSDFVHTGTYALIFSTLLSIGILLFYFRGNLNLFKKNKQLKQISFIWIVQNVFLMSSVGLRNAHYIGQCGLTYKRIGVFIFLLVVSLSLLYLFLKIKNRKSYYYYFRTCGWGLFGTLLVSGLINWDILITVYNTSSKNIEPDYYYLKYSLSDQVYGYVPEKLVPEMNYFSKQFVDKVRNRDWQSFNLGDYWAAERIEKMYPRVESCSIEVEPPVETE